MTRIQNSIQIQDLDIINIQRRKWLIASSVVYTCVILLIFGWDFVSDLHQKLIWWVIVSLILIVCMNWWYWTMRIIRQMLVHHENMYTMVFELLNDINELKTQLSKMTIDKDKY